MKTKIYLLTTLVFMVISCKNQESELVSTKHLTIKINDSIASNKSIDHFISPYKNHLNKTLDSTLAYAPETYSKKDYGSKRHLNTAIGNFMADVVYTQASPIFKSRTGKNIDAVLLNHGGIRSVITKGNITTRTAYKVMPFENSIVVVALKKPQINQLIEYLSKQHTPHPISHIKLLLNKDYSVNKVNINNQALEDRVYYIATSDYLYNGGDHMNFFSINDSVYDIGYKIRNSLIDYFIKVDTISPKIDDRFTKLN